jgi:Spy/CpxP family protein refolding chaperone
MKKHLLSFIVLSALLTASASQTALAFQESESSQDQVRGGRPTPEEVVERLDKKLSLTDDQKAKITPIIAARQEKLKALAADQSGRRMQKARKAKSIFQESDNQIKAILNDQQKQRYAELEQQMREEMKQRRHQRDQ